MTGRADRWMTPEGGRLRDDVFTRLGRGESLDGLPLGNHDGRIDLRSIPAPGVTVASSQDVAVDGRSFRFDRFAGRRPEIRRTALRGIDFSGARLERVMFVDVAVEDCRFDGAKLAEAGFWGSTIRGSTFRKADLSRLVLGGTAKVRTRWERVDFDAAKLRGANPGDADFVDCDFGSARLQKVEFYGSQLVRCRFAGTLREVIISALGLDDRRSGALEEVDFSAATFRWTSLRGFDLASVRLPEGDGHVRFTAYPCTLRRALAELAGTSDPDKRWLVGLLEHEVRWLGPRQRQGVLAIADLQSPGTLDAGRPIAAWLTALDAECRAAGDS